MWHRPNNLPNDATPYDEAPSNTSSPLAGSQYTKWETLDRAGPFILVPEPNFSLTQDGQSSPTKQMLDHVNPEHHLRSMIGYHLAWENSLIGMVMVQGKQREVINIGLGIKQVAVEPRDVTVPQYVESLSHKVRVCGTLFFFCVVIRFCFVCFTNHPRGRPLAW